MGTMPTSESFLAPNRGFELAKAAIFDLDGTLLESVDLHASFASKAIATRDRSGRKPERARLPLRC
jgi:phosphoglycolate phosphatase-like HAD superfamily hydrolase